MNQHVLLIGEGGAASALATTMAAANVAEIGLYDLDDAKAEQLAKLLRVLYAREFSSPLRSVGVSDD